MVWPLCNEVESQDAQVEVVNGWCVANLTFMQEIQVRVLSHTGNQCSTFY